MVIVSHPDRAGRKDPVEVLLGSTQRAGRTAEANEFILDEADKLDWPTIFKCDLIWAVPRHELKQHRGAVSRPRRAALVRKIIASHGWPEILASV